MFDELDCHEKYGLCKYVQCDKIISMVIISKYFKQQTLELD